MSNCRCSLRRNSSDITRRKEPRQVAKKPKEDRIWKEGKRKQASIVFQFSSICWWSAPEWVGERQTVVV